MTKEGNEKDSFINLSNLSQLTTLSILMLIIFAVVRVHIYYQLFLHIPIFQYMDASDLIMMTPATGVIWIFYLGCVNLSNFIMKSKEFNLAQRIVFPIFIYGLVGSIMYVAYHNDPIIKETILMPLGHYWYIYFLLLTVFIIVYQYPDVNGPVFFQKNKFILPLILTVWYGLYEGFANYELIKSSKNLNHIALKSKTGAIISTNQNIVYAGRTKSYWFFYNRSTSITRVIKNDDIEVVDFK